MLNFKTLWENHPTTRKEDAPCKDGDHKAFENQCAVRMGVCLERSGVSTHSFHGARCWLGHDPAHILRAEELANWLAKSPVGLHRLEKYSGKKAFAEIRGRTGIVFFQNYYGPGNQGDHIDLWNGSSLTDWRTWFTIHVYGENYSKSQSVWFWAIP